MASAPAPAPDTVPAGVSTPTFSKGNLRDDLTCAVCYDLFREPVMLACMHNFCKLCICQYWRETAGLIRCPQCRKEFSSKRLQTNYLLSSIVDNFRIATSDTHIQNHQKQLRDRLEGHHLRKEVFIRSLSRDKDKMDAIKRVAADLQARIKGDFRALHQILHDEEACLLEQLKQEQAEELERVQRHIEAAEQGLMELEDNLRVLQHASTTADSEIMTELPPQRPYPTLDAAPEFDATIFSSKYVAPLQYITWRKMFKLLKPGPSPLTFDEDTAHRSIRVSMDQTSALEVDDVCIYPDNNKRFLQCVNILALQGFQSGRHYWEVEVGSKPKWDVGVASETVDRLGKIKLSPENGFWTLRMRNGNECSAGTQPWTRLPLSSAPQRLGVFLDFEDRRVSFYNADDMSLLYSFTNGPRSKVFPFFSPCINDSRDSPQPMRLLHYPPAALSC